MYQVLINGPICVFMKTRTYINLRNFTASFNSVMISTYSVLVRDRYARMRTENIKVDQWLPTDLKEAFG